MLESKNLYFINSKGKAELLVSNITEKQAWSVIRSFLDEHNFKSYYTRTWNVAEGTMYDVGSHSEFFLWGFTK